MKNWIVFYFLRGWDGAKRRWLIIKNGRPQDTNDVLSADLHFDVEEARKWIVWCRKEYPKIKRWQIIEGECDEKQWLN